MKNDNEMVIFWTLLTLFLLCFVVWMILNNSLQTQMEKVCQNMSMEFSHKESGSFYCVELEPPFRTQKVIYQ